MGIETAIIGALVSTGASAIAGTLVGSFFSTFLVRAAIGIALNALAPKPKPFSGAVANRGYITTQRGSALDHQIIYGRARVGGVVVFDASTGDTNEFLHRVLCFAGHEVESFDEIYINDEIATIDANGFVQTPAQYANLIRIQTKNGTADQTAFDDLVAEESLWTTSHRLRGLASMYVRFEFNQDAFPDGVPEITATIKGKKLFDPRSGTTGWSDNAALCVRDYLTSDYGLGETSDNIDDTSFITAANVCDETVSNGSARYTTNGAFVTSIAPFDVLNDLTGSMAGLTWYSQGKWRNKPASYVAPTISLNEDDLRSTVSVKTRGSRRDNFNVVRGTFRGEESNWQPTDYPEVTNAAFLAADGGQESVLDFSQPFTDNSNEARRLALIALERNRQQLQISASWGLKAFQLQTGDIVNISLDRFGWSNKEFEVQAWTFGLAQDNTLEVQMSLREISESVFDEINDGIVYERDNTNLPSAFYVPPVGIATSSETQVLNEKLTNIINVTTTATNPSRIDRVEVEFRRSDETEWQSGGTGELGVFRLVDLDATTYDVRARGINTFGVKGEWNQVDDVDATNPLDPPSDVTGFTAEVNGATVHLEWTAVSDADLSFYKIRHAVEETGASWPNATTAVSKVSRPGTAVSLPARPGTYLIKAVDKLGIESTNAASIVVPSANLESFTTTSTQSEDPGFTGTKTNTSVDTSALVISTPVTAGDTGTYDFSAVIDTGSVRLVRSRVEATVVRQDNSSGLWDDLPGNFDDLPGLFDGFTGGADFSDIDVEAYISTTDDDPSGSPTWSAYQLFRAGEYSGRAFRFRVILKTESDDITPSITALDAIVEYN